MPSFKAGVSALALLLANAVAASPVSKGWLTGYAQVPWREGDLTTLAIKQVPPPGSVVRIWHPFTLDGADGRVEMGEGTFVKVARAGDNGRSGAPEKVRVYREARGGDLFGWVPIDDMPLRGNEPIEIDGRHFEMQRLANVDVESGGRWEPWLSFSGISPQSIRAFSGTEQTVSGTMQVTLLFVRGQLVRVDRFLQPPDDSGRHERFVIDQLEQALGKPVCRVADRSTVVCSWRDGTGVLVVAVRGRVLEPPARDFPMGPPPSSMADETVWAVDSVVNLGARLEVPGESPLRSRRGEFYIVRYSIFNTSDTAMPLIYSGGIPHPVVHAASGSSIRAVGVKDVERAEAIVRYHSGDADARVLHHLAGAIGPHQMGTYYAVYEVPRDASVVSLSVASSTARTATRQLIPIRSTSAYSDQRQGGDEVPAPGVGERRSLWTVLDKQSSIDLGSLYAAFIGFDTIGRPSIADGEDQ